MKNETYLVGPCPGDPEHNPEMLGAAAKFLREHGHVVGVQSVFATTIVLLPHWEKSEECRQVVQRMLNWRIVPQIHTLGVLQQPNGKILGFQMFNADQTFVLKAATGSTTL